MLKGIDTPSLATFLDDDGINEGELRRMINWFIEKGVSGLYPNGSTGEFIRLSFEEQKRVIQIVAEETPGRLPHSPTPVRVLTASDPMGKKQFRAVPWIGYPTAQKTNE